MSHQKLLTLMTGLTLVVLLGVGCGAPTPTATPVSEATPQPTETEAAVESEATAEQTAEEEAATTELFPYTDALPIWSLTWVSPLSQMSPMQVLPAPGVAASIAMYPTPMPSVSIPTRSVTVPPSAIRLWSTAATCFGCMKTRWSTSPTWRRPTPFLKMA